MKITKDQLAQIAKLAKLNLPKNQKDQFLSQLESILEYFEILNKTNTKNVNPTYQVTGLKNILREDVIDTNRMFTQAEALANAPKQKNGYFVIKSISKK